MAVYTVMGQSNNDFIWDGNAVAANQGMWLLQVFQLTGERRYLNGARSNADYLLGRNASGYCYITGFSTKSPMHPHHRPSIADGIQAPVPCLLVGGPNPASQYEQIYPNNYPETAYTDNDKAYAANEIAINWNAPAVFLLNGLNYWALQKAW
jgi:endoglucanase